MVSLRSMEIRDIQKVLEWNEEGQDFLVQWSNFIYPLTAEQFRIRIISKDYLVFSIEKDGKTVGTIQLFRIDREKASARVGCYLIDPAERGKGIGTEALAELVHYAFSELKLSKLDLGVFDYNTGAQRCYEKVGFVKTSEYKHPLGWVGYQMEISKPEELNNKGI